MTKTHMNNQIPTELKTSLDKEQTELRAELEAIAKPDPDQPGVWVADFPQMSNGDSGSSSAEEDNADEVEEYETRLGMIASMGIRLHEVEQALNRMEEGRYGTCKVCGKEIAIDRLHANPAALYDVDHEPSS